MAGAMLSAIATSSGCSKNKASDDGGIPTITWYVPGSQMNDTPIVLEKANEILEKEVGAKLDLIFVDNAAYKSAIIGFSADTTPIRTEITQIQAVVGEYSVINKGAKDPDTYYNDFIAKLKTAGIDKVVAEVDKQVKEYLQSK